MLSMLPQSCQVHNQVVSFLPGPLTDTGRLWHIVAGKKEYKLELPSYDPATQLLTFRKMRYGLANIALPNTTKILSRYDPKVLRAIVEAEPQAEPWELVALMPEGPEAWHFDDYIYKSGLQLAQETLSEVILKAFAPDKPAQPHWIQERTLRELRQGSGESNRAATIFYLVDDSKPRDAERVQRIVLFRDRQMIESWLRCHEQSQFRRSVTFAGRLDFLTTQGDESMYKAFLIEGVSIAGDGTLKGQNPTQTMISTTWRCPMGASIDPVRGGIIGASNKVEGLEMFVKEHGWVEHNPVGENMLHTLDATAWDPIDVPNLLPGINANVGLCTWPQWLVKDGVMVSRSFAERAVHQVPQHFSFWTGEDFEFCVPEGEDASLPPTTVIEPRQVICLDGDRPVKAPDDLLKGALIDPARYRRNVSYCQDTKRPVVWFALSGNQQQTEELRLGVQGDERHLNAEQFLARRGLTGNWQLVRLPEQRVMETGEIIADSSLLQARPYFVQFHHQLLFVCNVPLSTGCKISTRTGSYKGVVRVVNDELMPHTMVNGELMPLDMIIAQENIPSRGIALAVLGEMALGKWGQHAGKTVLAGRNVTREQVLALAGEEAQPETLQWPSHYVRFKNDGGTEVEGRVIMNTSSWGEATYYAVSVSGQMCEVCDTEFLPYEDGSLIRHAPAHVTHGATGPLFLMIMNRHPLVVAGIRPSLSRNSNHLIQRGDGSVSLGLNEFQVMRSLGMDEAAAQMSYQDTDASNYARELCESLLGGIYRQGALNMTELEQALQMRGLDRTALDAIDPALVDVLADVAAGTSNTRRSILIEGRPNTHWQFSVVQAFVIDPAFKDYEAAWRGEIAATVRYALYLQDTWPWKLISETDDGQGGSVCTFQRMDEQGQPRAQVVYRKVVGAFETRNIPVAVADDGELDTER